MIGTQKAGFPATFAGLETGFLLEVYAAGANRLNQSIVDLTIEDLRARPRADKWTILEILAHTLDSEIMATLRIGFVTAQPDSNFILYNQDIWAKIHDYQSLTSEELNVRLEVFAGLRKMNLQRFQRATAADWRKKGFHPELGAATLRNLIELYSDHVERHVEQILHLRELLGKPIELSLLLPTRLY